MTPASSIVSVLLFALVWWGPGWAIGAALGVRRLLLAAAAPAIGLGFYSVLGWLWAVVGIPWHAGTVLAAAVVVTLLLAAVRRLASARRVPAPRRRRRPLLASYGRLELGILAAGLAVGVLIGAVTWLRGTEFLSGVYQDWDVPWHVNMIRLVAESGLAEPGIARNFGYYDTAPEDALFRAYPIALHSAIALVYPWAGAPVHGLVNAAFLVLTAVQAPISAMALTALISRRPVAIAAAAAFTPWLAAFPWDPLARGPQYPFHAALLLLGPFLVLAAAAAASRAWWWIPAVALAANGLAAAHASVVLPAGLMIGAWLAGRLVVERREAVPTGLHLLASGALAVVLGIPLIGLMLLESERVASVIWAPDAGRATALRNLVLLQHFSVAAWVIAALALVGGLSVLRRPRKWWYLVPLFVAAGFSFVTMTVPYEDPSWLPLTQFFYDDQWRFFAWYVILAVPLAGLGLAVVADLGLAAARRIRPVAVGPRAQAVAAGLVFVVALVGLGPHLRENVARLAVKMPTDGRVLTAAEVRLMSRLADRVGFEDMVLSDQCDGSAWMYALSGRRSMLAHYENMPTERQLLLVKGFARIAEDPAVLEAAAQVGIGWVYVSDGFVNAEWDAIEPGLRGLEDLPFLEPADSDGGARLYRVLWDEIPGGREAWDRYASTRIHRDDVAGTWETTIPDEPAVRWC